MTPPKTDPIYAIGDIHGQLTMLEDALARIVSDGGPDARVVFLGDLVDRGPDSRGVIDLLARGVAEGRNWTVLKGNHDRMFARFLAPTPVMETGLLVGWDWFHENLGGRETLASYGVMITDQTRIHAAHAEARAAVPRSHIDFMSGLPTHLVFQDKLFVHAGIRPGIALESQTEDDLVWIREPFLGHSGPHPWLVVHGHTPLPQARHFGNRIDLDSGAGFGRPLTAAVIDEDGVFLLGPTGRTPLRPDH
ncbi:metallophosphoesterase family protein [Shimia biformata]|uniref:metallophosphoesterase family protein n=1 Tax=Shimia biformata TaxID=1294299 RepID=UPI00194E6F75|nr:metallophosphoesterase family protein [Shimia biformata]